MNEPPKNFVPLNPPGTPAPVYGHSGVDPHPAVGAFILTIAVVLIGWNIFPLLQSEEGKEFSTWGIHWAKVGFGLCLWLIGMALLAQARYMSWASGIGYGLLFLPGLVLLLWNARHNTRHSAWDTQEELSLRFRPMRCLEALPLRAESSPPPEKPDYSDEWAQAIQSNLLNQDPAGVHRRRYSSEEIAWLLRQHVEEGRPISTICQEHLIDEGEFLGWLKNFGRGGAAASERPPPTRRRDLYNEKLEQLEARLRQKDEVIASLSKELMRSKNDFLER